MLCPFCREKHISCRPHDRQKTALPLDEEGYAVVREKKDLQLSKECNFKN